MDPLSVLRDFIVSKQLDKVVVEGDRVHFGDQYSFSKTAFTTFKSNRGTGDFYQLEVVLFFYQYGGANAAEYVRRCTQQGVALVAVPDRKPLRDYLEGVTDAASLPQIADVVPAYADNKRAAEQADLEPAAKRAKPAEADGEASALLLLAQQERQLRDRNSMLLAPNCSFEKVLSILDKAMKVQQPQPQQKQPQRPPQKEAGAKAAPKPQAQPPLPPQPPTAAAFLKPSGRFERDTTSDAYRAMGMDASLANDLGLGYTHAEPETAPPPPPPSTAPPPPPPVPAAAANGRASSHKAAGPSGAGAADKAAARASRPVAAADARAGRSSSSSKSGKARSSAPPIILVPSGMTAMVNMFNARRLLEKGEFVRSDTAMKANPTKPPRVTFARTQLRAKPVQYEITDKAPPKGSPDWSRVVAVIVQGKAWQFKDWPHKGADKGDLLEAFNKVLGVYVHYRDEAIPDAVKNWKVVHVPIHRDSRHLDKTAVLELYKALDTFLKAKGSTLTY